MDYAALTNQIKTQAKKLGFQQLGISDIKLDEDEQHLNDWLAAGMHGEMEYMQRHGSKRSHPEELIPGTCRVISVRMDYLPPDASHPKKVLGNDKLAYISRYAMGRDYHKLMRQRLQRLTDFIQEKTVDSSFRVFVDSAPVLEKALARNAGLGWIGKHSNLINKQAGSWFFLGEIYTDLPLLVDEPFTTQHCGHCQACIDVCPTNAIIGPYQVDARKCISYLTIELRGSIPVQYRQAIGNRIYGCDDCQLICPWNRFAQNTEESDFRTRHGFDTPKLIELFKWTETEFLNKTEGSAIRRIGYACWIRNIAVALGNANTSQEIIDALQARRDDPSELIREHVVWALEQHEI